jgi:hypothetical protein
MSHGTIDGPPTSVYSTRSPSIFVLGRLRDTPSGVATPAPSSYCEIRVTNRRSSLATRCTGDEVYPNPNDFNNCNKLCDVNGVLSLLTRVMHWSLRIQNGALSYLLLRLLSPKGTSSSKACGRRQTSIRKRRRPGSRQAGFHGFLSTDWNCILERWCIRLVFRTTH